MSKRKTKASMLIRLNRMTRKFAAAGTGAEFQEWFLDFQQTSGGSPADLQKDDLSEVLRAFHKWALQAHGIEVGVGHG